MDAYSKETVTLLEQALQRLRNTPLASFTLLSQLQDVIELAEVELDSEEE